MEEGSSGIFTIALDSAQFVNQIVYLAVAHRMHFLEIKAAFFTKQQTNSPIKHFATSSTHIIVIYSEVNA